MTSEAIVTALGMLLFFGFMGLLVAIPKIIGYAIKVWFTTTIVKKTWMGK